MKTLFQFIIAFGCIGVLNGQIRNTTHFDEFEKNVLNTKTSISFKAFNKMNLSPQFGGLFQNELDKGPQALKWRQIYNDHHLGFNFSSTFNLMSSLKLKVNYYTGVLKFKTQAIGRAPTYISQLTLTYSL